MFHVENEPVDLALWHSSAERALRFPERYVVDHERDAWLQFVGADGPSGDFGMRLGVGDRVVPFLGTKTRHTSADGREYVLTDVFGFGATIYVTRRTGTPSYSFRDDAERDQLAVLAAEAIFVYWIIWGGDNAVEGRNRVRVPMHGGSAEFTLSSFGYELNSEEVGPRSERRSRR